MKYAWIASNKAHWPITLACEVLGVSASGYFEHGRRKTLPKPSKPGSHKRMSDEALLTHIRAIHAEVKGEYGWPKMWKELVARGHRVGKERVRRLMQLHGIRARCKRKFVITTDSKHHLPIAPDLVQRNFTMSEPNQVWTGDITYIATDEGWVYQQRVIAECEQLADRIQKLEAFMSTPVFAGLPEDEQQLLKMQADAMVLYLGIINTRASKFA